MQKVTLSGPHTHRGKPVSAGTSIEVSDSEAKWLERRGLIVQPAVVSNSSTVAAPQAGKKTKLENDGHVAD